MESEARVRSVSLKRVLRIAWPRRGGRQRLVFRLVKRGRGVRV